MTRTDLTQIPNLNSEFEFEIEFEFFCHSKERPPKFPQPRRPPIT
jgi:hypothetical protein